MNLLRSTVKKVLNKVGWNFCRTGDDFVLISSRGDVLRREKKMCDWLFAQHIRYLLAHYEINCIIDVGANRGQYGNLMRSIGYTAKLISFEPVPLAFHDLAAVADSDSKWSIYQYALGAQNTSISMNVHYSTNLSSIRRMNSYGEFRYGARRYGDKILSQSSTINVDARRLDSVLDELLEDTPNPKILLKMDTQGFDVEVFSGVGEWIHKILVLQSEVSTVPIYEDTPHYTKALKEYEAKGFEISGMFPVTIDEETARVIEFDCVMVNSSTSVQKIAPS